MRKKDRIEQTLRDTPKLIRQRDVIKAVQSEGILKRLIAGGWITPCVREKKYTAYKRADVEKAVERILGGEMPPPLPPREIIAALKATARNS